MKVETWLRVGEAAAKWKVSEQTVRRWLHEGRIEGARLGPRTLRVLVVTEEGEREAPKGEGHE